MAKINLSLVEKAIADVLYKIKLEDLLWLAEALTGTPSAGAEIKDKRLVIKGFVKDLCRLIKKEPEAYKELGAAISELEKLLKSKSAIEPDVWSEIIALKNKVEEVKNISIRDPSEDEAQVEKERQRHINKRFNVNERWLPLD